MKRTVLAFAAVVAATSFSMADTGVRKQHRPVACSKSISNQKLDCQSTGSVTRYSHACPATANASARDKKPRLGIDIYPWFFPQFY